MSVTKTKITTNYLNYFLLQESSTTKQCFKIATSPPPKNYCTYKVTGQVDRLGTHKLEQVHVDARVPLCHLVGGLLVRTPLALEHVRLKQNVHCKISTLLALEHIRLKQNVHCKISTPLAPDHVRLKQNVHCKISTPLALEHVRLKQIWAQEVLKLMCHNHFKAWVV